MAGFMRRTIQGNAWTPPLSTMKRRGAGGGSWVDIQNVYYRSADGNSWVRVWAAYKNVTGSITPAAANGSASGSAVSGRVVSNGVTAQGADGNGNYTYVWSVSNVTAGSTVTIATPNSSATTFSSVVNGNDGNVTFTANCTISDGQSSVVVSVPGRLSYANRN